jgi:hypothetical protein
MDPLTHPEGMENKTKTTKKGEKIQMAILEEPIKEILELKNYINGE